MAKGSEFAEHAIAGMALASMELNRSLISLLVLHKVVPREMMIMIIDLALQRIETMQATHISSIVGPAKAARLHIEVLLKQLIDLPEAGA